MKPLLDWLKSNWLIATFVAAILAILPASYLGSQAWGNSVRAKQEQAAAAELAKIQAAKVDYTLPNLDPKGTAISHKAEPNKILNDWFAAKKKELNDEASSVVRRAVDFNRGVGPDAAAVYRKEFKPLVEGLFPDGTVRATEEVRTQMTPEKFDALSAEDKAKAIATRKKEIEKPGMDAFEDAILGKRGPTPYQGILLSVRAGDRLDPVRLNDTLADLRTREIEKITANKRELNAEESSNLTKLLTERRLAEAQSYARSISVYATMGSMPISGDGSLIPVGVISPANLNILQFFNYQWDIWFLQDIFASVRLANTSSDGQLLSVDQSVVKRIEAVMLKDVEGLYSGTKEDILRDTGQYTEPTATIPGIVPLDMMASHTGRGMGKWNKYYDVRRAEITVIVSSQRLNEFIDAITRTNFMTVTDLDLSEVDAWGDLRQGYYYGPDHVVRAKVGIESVWLREWFKSLMPSDLRAVLGVPADEAATPETK